MWRRRSCSCQKPGNHPWLLPFSCPPESNQLPNCVNYCPNISVSLHLHYWNSSCHPPPSSSGTSSSSPFSWITIKTSLTVLLYHIHFHSHLTCHTFQVCTSISDQREHLKMQTWPGNSPFQTYFFLPNSSEVQNLPRFRRSCLSLQTHFSPVTLVSQILELTCEAPSRLRIVCMLFLPPHDSPSLSCS